MVLARLRFLADENTAPLDRVHQPRLLEASIGVLGGGVGDFEPLLLIHISFTLTVTASAISDLSSPTTSSTLSELTGIRR